MEALNNEEWKAIPCYEGIYEVSSFGRVKSLARYAYGSSRFLKEKILKLRPTWQGYQLVVLRDREGIPCGYGVHCLVLLAFVGPCPLEHQVRHYPVQDPSCNFLSNLSYSTRSTNQLDRRENDTDLRGEKHHNCKLTEKKVKNIKKALSTGVSASALARQNGVQKAAILKIKHNRTWRHLDAL